MVQGAQGSGIEVKVGEAWEQLRGGRTDEAIASFEKLLAQVPNNVDAHYGLGLALRTKGQNADAIETFQKAKEIAGQMLDAIRSQLGVENSLNSIEDDRYMMLGRMISQRLSELGVSS